MENKQLLNTLSYLNSELNRIETMAGSLSTAEREHYNKLQGFDHAELKEIAVEEQSASRQLGTIKQMCLSMAQEVAELQNNLKSSGNEVKK